MVRCALKRSLRPASCCSVDVMKGAAGLRRKGRSLTELTSNSWPVKASARNVASSSASTRTGVLASSSPVDEKSRPVASGVPSTATSEAVNAEGVGTCSAEPPRDSWAPAEPLGDPAEEAGAAVRKVPSTPHQVAGRKRIRARSRSTTIRVATLWTRPADSRGITFFHSTGETS